MVSCVYQAKTNSAQHIFAYLSISLQLKRTLSSFSNNKASLGQTYLIQNIAPTFFINTTREEHQARSRSVTQTTYWMCAVKGKLQQSELNWDWWKDWHSRLVIYTSQVIKGCTRCLTHTLVIRYKLWSDPQPYGSNVYKRQQAMHRPLSNRNKQKVETRKTMKTKLPSVMRTLKLKSNRTRQ